MARYQLLLNDEFAFHWKLRDQYVVFVFAWTE